MKYLSIMFLIAVLVGCSSTPVQPSQFEIDTAKGKIRPSGCQELIDETEKYNKEHGTNKTADC